MKKSLSTLLLVSVIALIIFWARRGPHVEESPIPEVLIVGTSADYKPFSFLENNEIIGFDIDVIKEAVKRLNTKNPTKMVLKNMPFELLLPQVQLDNVHIIAAGMTATPERAQRVAFTEPHLTEDPLLIVGLKENPALTSLEDLNGKTVLVSQGYTADMYISKLPHVTVSRLGSLADLMLALTNGRADYLATSAKSFAPLLEQYGADCFTLFTIADVNENNAFATNKERKVLIETLNDILREMEQDGTLTALKEKWNLL